MKHNKDLTNNSQGLISSKHIIMVGGVGNDCRLYLCF